MPDVGLFTATEPVSSDTPVIIKFSVEVGGLPVYQESYDVDTLREEDKADPDKIAALWLRRLRCVLESRDRPGFSAALTSCLATGMCGDHGQSPGQKVIDPLGIPTEDS
ncbi:hypothetical protein [Verrucomicrobium sp. BvORR106]|uniref:hypothetical protein n=1 Tax=Verrucomicrobium sp. BvORR106 TaxID=1403819 RepID=UPI002240FE84|nr:hypothetical protein [Verrucomicrobium sp. BvORR106]